MQVAVTHFLPLTHIRRERLLPVNGRVLVKKGQKVAASDVIAEAELRNQHILVDVRQALRLPRNVDVSKLIDRRSGDKVEEGDVLAQRGGIFRRVVRAPASGEIVHISGGQVMIELKGAPQQLLAGFNGEVVEVITNRGAMIEADGALLQGVWGNQRVNGGLLLMLARGRDDVLTDDRLDISMRGSVVVAGHCAQAEALMAAAQLPLRGLVLSSMSADLIPLAEKQEFPILLLDGIGRIPMNSAAYKILSTHEKHDLCINAVAWNAFNGERPEAFIPLPASGQPAPEAVTLKSGKTVRMIGAPYDGVIGVVVNVLSGQTLLPTGLRSAAAEVRLEDNQMVTVPLPNLDVLE